MTGLFRRAYLKRTMGQTLALLGEKAKLTCHMYSWDDASTCAVRWEREKSVEVVFQRFSDFSTLSTRV